ncbi:hypothetical protein AHMF7605_10465 [Adhaeribacter arboris]|uniref:Uncharacterized protein n=1 Tax=Adhaeribacter arboris TaxID=2072846 RepID=A0A2T2YEG7_9BACT|nr:hypothetical protein AHMF7605_10465 [Adhaeribacter arboris]
MDINIKIFSIKEDGLPSTDECHTGRVAFFYQGHIISGWPTREINKDDEWEADSDVGKLGVYTGVTHYTVLPKIIWSIITV